MDNDIFCWFGAKYARPTSWRMTQGDGPFVFSIGTTLGSDDIGGRSLCVLYRNDTGVVPYGWHGHGGSFPTVGAWRQGAGCRLKIALYSYIVSTAVK